LVGQSWEQYAPGGLNYLQSGERDLRCVFSGLRGEWGSRGLWNSVAGFQLLAARSWAVGAGRRGLWVVASLFACDLAARLALLIPDFLFSSFVLLHRVAASRIQ